MGRGQPKYVCELFHPVSVYGGCLKVRHVVSVDAVGQNKMVRIAKQWSARRASHLYIVYILIQRRERPNNRCADIVPLCLVWREVPLQVCA